MLLKGAVFKSVFVTMTISLMIVRYGGLVNAQPATQVEGVHRLSFEQAVALAADSPAVQIAAGQLTLAQHQLNEASALVSGGLIAGYTQSWTPEVEDAPNAGSYDPITATANLNVVPYGDAADAALRAEWTVRQAGATLEATRADAVVDVATTYLEALRYSQEKKALEAAVGVAQTALEATRTRLEAGAANDADLLDAQIALSQAQNDLAVVALEEDQALAVLAQTLGVSVTAVAGEPPNVALPELGDTTARIETRSDVVSARLEVQSAALERSAALRSVLPTGSVGLSYSTTGVELGAGFSTESYQPSFEASYDPDGPPGELMGEASGEGLSAQLSLSIPLDSSLGATLAVAETAAANAELVLGQTRAQARLELQAARSQLTTSRNSLAAARALVEQRRQSLDTTRTRLSLGLVPTFEVESAEAGLLGAQVQLDRLEDDVLLAQLILLQTLALNPMEVL